MGLLDELAGAAKGALLQGAEGAHRAFSAMCCKTLRWADFPACWAS